MTTLHFDELGIAGAETVRVLTARALGEFESHLKRTKEYLESTALRLGWKSVDETQVDGDAPLWVELLDPPDRPEEPDRTFDAFLDEEVSAVFELTGEDGSAEGPSATAFRNDRRIAVLDRDLERRRLFLAKRPTMPLVSLAPATRPIVCQLRAVRRLKSMPLVEHTPLLRLFENTAFASWPELEPAEPVEKWYELTDDGRPGTDLQQRFVEIALTTPDFAILEGPPGSGKTTAITELVLQLVRRGKRVMLCASTHVAVDNVLEKLVRWSDGEDSDVIAVRIGDRTKVSDKARRFQIDDMQLAERRRLVTFLESRRAPSAAQAQLLASLRDDSSSVGRLLLDCANVVCGTTIGILRHPDLNVRGGFTGAPPFDVLILDEASKTTFHEFLVPALLAERWVIVGDPRQLSPYVDEKELQANLIGAVADSRKRDACADAFSVTPPAGESRTVWVVTSEQQVVSVYQAEAGCRGIRVARAADPAANDAQFVLGAAEGLARLDPPPGRTVIVRGSATDVGLLSRRRAGGGASPDFQLATDWEEEVAWRLSTKFQLRFSYLSVPAEDAAGDVPRSTKIDQLEREIESLLPAANDADRSEARKFVSRACRVALPSIIEVLQRGNDRRPDQREATAMTEGLPETDLNVRHVLLRHQHRMYPSISAAPRKHVYLNEALIDAPDMENRRRWSYERHEQRAVWAHVPWKGNERPRESVAEAEAVDEEIRRFLKWARTSPRPDGEPWEVAVLPFYRAQERLLRGLLRERTGARDGHRHFRVSDGARPIVTIELCTVDRFQGHEADVVLVSFASGHPTSFLECQNRLNVALTRARYLRILIGDHDRLARSHAPLLRALALEEPWSRTMRGAS
jgi:hypothetical protein